MSDILKKDKIYKENRVWIRISSACNNRCIFCLDSDAHNGTFGDEKEIKQEILSKYKKGEFNKIIISGGEASINPKFVGYIEYAKSVGYKKIQTITNGVMFSNLDFCKKVIETGLQEITFSLHGHTSSLHDYLVGTSGSFKKAIKGLIYIKKYFPQIIVNVDIVANKININYLPDIIKFFMKLGIYEFDILQIIPFGRGFKEYKDKLFYNPKDYREKLKEVWKLSKIPQMYIWTNRFPVEVFNGYEELIQDPRKITSEVMGEAIGMYENFIGKNIKPNCFGERCNYCFLKQFCEGILDLKTSENKNYIDNGIIINGKTKKELENFKGKYFILKGDNNIENIYRDFGKTKKDFLNFLKNLKLGKNQFFVNIPYCIKKESNNFLYENFLDLKQEKILENYTNSYISNLYRKKSLNCKNCKYNSKCQGIHINFIRAYSFNILKPVINSGKPK